MDEPMEQPGIPESEVRLVELIFPHQTNHIGTLLGGNEAPGR